MAEPQRPRIELIALDSILVSSGGADERGSFDLEVLAPGEVRLAVRRSGERIAGLPGT
jgi:hypothetical protein